MVKYTMKRKRYQLEPLDDGPREKCRHWGIRVSCGHDPATGKRLRPYETFEGTEYEADLRAMAIKVEHGIVETTSMTVAEYFVGMYLPWAKSRVRTKSYEGGPRDKSLITRETYRGYEQTARLHIIPLFGHIGLSDLKPYYVEQKLAEIPSLGSRRNAYKLLRQGYRRAVKWQLLQFVVTDAVEEPTADPVDKPTVKSAEMWDYIDAFDEPGDEDVRMAVAIGFGIGLRRSEIAAIDKEEIDWTVDTEDFLGAVRIWRSYHFRKGEGWFEPPKSFTSARTAYFPRWLGELLQPHAEGSGPLLEHKGERTKPDRITDRWKDVVAKKGLPVVMPFKNTRHSCGTILVREDGLPITDVQQLLGHSTPVITSTFYVQRGTESTERVAAAMNKRAKPVVPDCPKPPENAGSQPDDNYGDKTKKSVSPGSFKIIRPDFKRASNG